MTIIEAAKAVLQGVEEPLHYKELTRRILDGGLWSTEGKTPWETINAQLSVDIKRYGKASYFVRPKPGHYIVNPDFDPATRQESERAVSTMGVVAQSGHGADLGALEAALVVLEVAEGPLHYREVARRVLERGLWSSSGKTPWDTINSQLAAEVKRGAEASPIVRHKRGVYVWRGAPVSGPIQGDLIDPEKSEEPPATETADKGADEEPSLSMVAEPEPEGLDSADGSNQSSKPVQTGVEETLTFTDAAQRVLEHFAGREPMHYRAITQKALEQGWLSTEGLTPEATLYTQIKREVHRREKRAEPNRFVWHGKGFVGLTSWRKEGIPGQIERHNKRVQRELHTRLRQMDPGDFEELIGELLAVLGFEEVEVTRQSKDGGIDVRSTLVVADVVRIRMAVQVKRWKGNIHSPIVQQVRGSLGAHEQGLIITTSDFSKGARKEAARADATPVGLMNGAQLVGLLVEHEIGVKRTSFSLFELEETDSED